MPLRVTEDRLPPTPSSPAPPVLPPPPPPPPPPEIERVIVPPTLAVIVQGAPDVHDGPKVCMRVQTVELIVPPVVKIADDEPLAAGPLLSVVT